MRGMFYDRQGNEITSEEWGELKLRCIEGEHHEIAVVEQTGVHAAGRDYEISTVWTGINMNFTGEGEPVIFETMIFPEAAVLDRYATEQEALEGHRRAVNGLTRSEQ